VPVVEKSVTDGVALLTLNRPDRLNAWTGEMEDLHFDLLGECGADPAVRVIVVTGAGRGFCAGADMDDLQGLEVSEETFAGRRPVRFPLSIPKPLIAAINGPVAGIGLVQALMCDLRFTVADAKFTTAFARRGLVAEHGISWILPRLVGPARALDLLMSARVLRGEEALALGLVNRVVEGDVVEAALEYARDLAENCSPKAMAAIKQQVYGDLERGLAESVDGANAMMIESLRAPDFAEGVMSFVEKRPPKFEPVS
jgi:enoyl-CoA hydratase/carnithine racemase